MELGRSGGVRGEGMDHANRFPRTLAGFVWSYRTWRKSIFMFLGNIGNSLHHQIPPNGSAGLQIGSRIVLKARVPSQELSNKLIFQKMYPKKKRKRGELDNLPKSSFFDKIASCFLPFFGPQLAGLSRPGSLGM